MGGQSRRRSRWHWRRDAERDHAHRPDDEELSARLDAVTRMSGLTPEEIRASLRRHHPDDELDEAEGAGTARGPTFAEQYSTESLFIGADDDLDEPDSDDPWQVLGLTPDASWPEVVIAHRDLARRFHPDHLGQASPEEQAEGAERMRQANIAYTVLRHLKER